MSATKRAVEREQATAATASGDGKKYLSPKERAEILAKATFEDVVEPVITKSAPTAPSPYVERVARAYEKGTWLQAMAATEQAARAIRRELNKALRQLNEENGTEIVFRDKSGVTPSGVYVVQVKPRDKQAGRGRPKAS